MADTKISALTAATTPLAGTEVLPIVQSGVTKQVSVANLTAGRAVSADSLALTGSPLPATSGGTGQSSYAVGDLLYASTTTALSKLADVATGNALISGGVGVAPSWGKIGLTTHVSGTLAVGNGGTGNTTGAATAVISNATTGVMQIVGPAASSTRVMTIPNANFTAARTDAGQTFTGDNQINGKVAVNSSTAATAALQITGGQRMLTYSATAAASSSATITISQSDFNTTNITGSMLVIAGGYGNNITGNVLGLWLVGGLLFYGGDPGTYTATAIVNTVSAGGSMSFAQSGNNYTVTLTNTDATSSKAFRVSVIVNG